VADNRGQDRKTVFFRDDDVDVLSPELQSFVDHFTARDLPVNYQVTPARLEDDTCEYLHAVTDRFPELVRLNQHGYEHQQILKGQHRWSEFAGHRPYSEQYELVRKGKELLEKRLGDRFSATVFTPPAHKYDDTTLDVLETLGFDVLSAAAYPRPAARLYYGVGRALRRTDLLNRRVSYHLRRFPGRRLVEVSTSVDVDMCEGNDGLVVKSAAQLVEEFWYCANRADTIGVLFHHNTYDDRKLATLAEFLDKLRGTPNLDFVTIEELAARTEST
jgi:hypothetical protein